MDIKYKCVNNFKLIALTEKEYFVRDRPKNMTYTALIAVNPQNPIMLKCINKIVSNVRNKYYGENALVPTGPGLLGTFFSKKDFDDMEIYFTDTTTDHFKKEYCRTNDERDKKLGEIFDVTSRNIKGNINVLSEVSQENRERYSAHSHIDLVQTFIKGLSKGV